MPSIWHPGADEIASSVRKEHGAVIINGKQVGTTLACPHCGGHFLSVRGSGHRRHFCTRCAQITCGAAACDPCKPFEQWLEEVERNATREMRLGV